MKKILSILLAFTIAFTGTWVLPAGSMETKAEEPADNVISISSAEDLAKIGTDAAYPLNGNYKLTEDIDLRSRNWTPIGGADGKRGGYSFSGTFDGNGHIISNLHISNTDNITNSQQWGLFGMVGSSSESNKASVKNLILTGVDIDVDVTAADEAYLSVGVLAGAVNWNTVIDNVAVIDGNIRGNKSNKGDVVGVGGLIGEMRPDKDESKTNNGVTISNVYIGADVESGSSTANNYASGIIGRIAYMKPASISSCIFTGNVAFKETVGNGICFCGADLNVEESAIACYYISGQGSIGQTVSANDLKEGTSLPGLDGWTVSAGGYLMPSVCTDVSGLQESLAWAGLSFEFAAGDSFSSVTGNFKVPLKISIGGKEETIAWSADGGALTVGADGNVTVDAVYADQDCVLTATTESGLNKQYKVHVKSNVKLQIDQEYAKVGETLTASMTGQLGDNMTVQYKWSVDGVVKGTDSSYTPQEADLEKMLTVTAEAYEGETKIGYYDPASMYISRLPVVYIDTDDGAGIYDKTNYKGASMRIQGNDTLNSVTTTLYDSKTSIRGRGNSSWNLGFSKLPYKLKLDKKTNLFDLEGKGSKGSKHWALLANYMDESLLRNKTSYDLAEKMGINPHLPSVHVEVVLNGKYAGNYQLVGNVRIDTGRVNIFDWEDLAEDVADEIRKAGDIAKDEQDALEDYLNENMQWITSGTVTYKDQTFTLSNYPKISLPKTKTDENKIDVSGGFLFELDTYYDEVSKFQTKNKLPIMFKSPEFIRPTYTYGWGEEKWEEPDPSKEKCDALYQYANQYIQAIEDCVISNDFHTVVEKKEAVAANASNFTEDFEGMQHYTDLVDMDSLVAYLVLNEFYWNTETMKKSTYMYKDLGEKLHIGPVWDMDWTSDSLISALQGEKTGEYRSWMVKEAAQGPQANSWYRYLIGDPYFVLKMYECYQNNWDYFNDIVKQGGIIDTEKAYLQEAADANNKEGYQHELCRVTFDEGVSRLKTFLTNRLQWMDEQFESPDTLIASLGKYQASSNVNVTVDTNGAETTKYTADLMGSGAKKAGFYINGKLAEIVDVTDGTAECAVSDSYLETKQDALNLVQVRAMDETGNLLEKGAISNYQTFSKTLNAPDLTGTVRILGSLKAGSVLKADVSDSNNTGDFSYQWLVDNEPVTGAVSETYRPTKNDIGKRVKVEVSSSFEQGTLTSEETAAITELLNDHLIINQVYGGGNNDATPVSHSFIELYNPTDSAISLSGYSLGYLSNGKNGKAAEEVSLALDGASIPSHASYLIRCEAQDTESFTGKLTIEDYDQEWTDRIIDNKQYKIVLYKGAKMEDAVSVNEEMTEGLALPDKTISKQKGIRRQAFADTDNNTEDFTVIEYNTASAAVIQAYRPRSLKDGAWQAEEPAAPTELTGTVSIRGNAIAGAILYADTLLENDEDGTLAKTLSYQWMADGNAITDVSGQFLKLTEKDAGKKFSVKVTSGSIDGELTYAMETAVQIVEAQREHLIINQVYGGGGKTEPPVSHSFIELYNPTSQAVSLDGYSLKYMSSSSADEEAKELSLSGSIPARTSYLIRCKAETNAKGFAYEIKDSDASWDLTISNKQYRVTLKKGESNVDGVSVNEEASEGTALLDPAGDTIISKNKSVRRIEFIDTDDNAADFETLNYSKLPAALLADVAPRSAKDGAWGLPAKPDENNPDEKDKADEILLSAANTALTEADGKEQSKYDAKDYEKLAAAKKALSDALKTGKKSEIELALQNLKDVLKTIKEKTASDQEPSKDETPKKGQSFLYNKGWYKITKMAQSGGTVTYVKPAGKGYKTISIPKEAVYAGIKFKVTEIAKNAMKNNKKLQKVIIGENVTKIGASAFMGDKNLKNIQIKSKALKSVGKNALKNVHAKCKIKVPKKKLNAYKKKLKKKGQKNSVKIVK